MNGYPDAELFRVAVDVGLNTLVKYQFQVDCICRSKFSFVCLKYVCVKCVCVSYHASPKSTLVADALLTGPAEHTELLMVVFTPAHDTPQQVSNHSRLVH